jgi:sugar O-acyltransferase (sialic acid O-acetyltransferase NeuD family)
MSIPLVIVGAGGHGREVHDVVEAINASSGPGAGKVYDVLGWLDDGIPDVELLDDRGVPHLGSIADLSSMNPEVRHVIGIGSPSVRRRVGEWAAREGRVAATLVHPAAVLGRHRIILGEGTVVCAMASITTNVRTGRHVHLNRGVTIGHDAVLGDYVTVNPQAALSGSVVIEDDVDLGTSSAVIQGRRIGARTVVGAGSVVIRDLPSGVTAVGVPAKPLRSPGTHSPSSVGEESFS